MLASLAELLDGLGVVTQILLATDQNLRDIRAEVMYFRAPLIGRTALAIATLICKVMFFQRTV